MNGYLPTWATLAETEQWLEDATGERWPLPRIIEAGIRPHAWAAVRPGEHPEVVKRVFGGRPEGFLSEFIFAGDLRRMAVDRRSIVITMTRTPDGEIVRFDPPVPVDLEDLRFSAEQIRKTANGVLSQSRKAVKRVDLIRTLDHEWPSIEGDLREASRNGLDVAKVPGRSGYWYEDAARGWASEHRRLRDGTTPGTSTGRRVHRL